MEDRRTYSGKFGRRTKTQNHEETSPDQRSTRSRTSSCFSASTSSSSCPSSSSTFSDNRRKNRSGCEHSNERFNKRSLGAFPDARADDSDSCTRRHLSSSNRASKPTGTKAIGVQKSLIKCLASNSDSDSSSDQRIYRKEFRGRLKGTKGNKYTHCNDHKNRVSSCEGPSNINTFTGERSLRSDSGQFRGSNQRSNSEKRKAIVHYDSQAETFLPSKHSQHKVRLLESRFERPCTRNYGKTKSEQRQHGNTETLSSSVSNDLGFQIRDCRDGLSNEHISKLSQPSTSSNPGTSVREISHRKDSFPSHLREKSSPVSKNDPSLIRRKRLRSELSKDGLWGGLPVMLRYQKLCKQNKLISVNLGQFGVEDNEKESCGSVSSEVHYSEVEEKNNWKNEKKPLHKESEISSGFIPLCSPETQPFSLQQNSKETQDHQACISANFRLGTERDIGQSNTRKYQSSDSGKEIDEHIFHETQNKSTRSKQSSYVAKSTSHRLTNHNINIENNRTIDTSVPYPQKVTVTSRNALNPKEHLHFTTLSKSPSGQILKKANNQGTSCEMEILKEPHSQSITKVKQKDFTTRSRNMKNLMYDLFGSESSDASPVSKASSKSSKSGFSVEEACMPSMSDSPPLKSEKNQSLTTCPKDSIRHFHQIFPASKSDEDGNEDIASVSGNQDSHSFKNEDSCRDMNETVEPSSPSTCQTCALDCNCEIINTSSSFSCGLESKCSVIQDTLKFSVSKCEAQSSRDDITRHSKVRPDQQKSCGLSNGKGTDTPTEISDASWTLGSLGMNNETRSSNEGIAQFSSCSETSSASPRRKVSFYPDTCGTDTFQHRPMIMASRSSGRTLDGCSTQSCLPESIYSPCQQSIISVATTSIPDVSSDYPNNTADTTQFGVMVSSNKVNNISETFIPSSMCRSDESQAKTTFRGKVHPNSYVFDVTQANDCSTLSCQPESVYSLHDRTRSPTDTLSSLPYASNDFLCTAGSSTTKWDAMNANISNVSIAYENDSTPTDTSMITVPSLREVSSDSSGKQVSGGVRKTQSSVSNSSSHTQKTENQLLFNSQYTTDCAYIIQNSSTAGEHVESIDDEFMKSLPSSIQNMFSKDVRTSDENEKSLCESKYGSTNFQASQLAPQTFTCNSSLLICCERESKVSFTSTNESNESNESSSVNYLGKRPENPRSRIVKGGYLPSVRNDSTSSVSSVDSDLKSTRLQIDLALDNSPVLFNQRLSGSHQSIHQQKDDENQPKRSTRLLNKCGTEVQDQMPSTSSSTFSRTFPLADLQERGDKCRYEQKQTQSDNFDLGNRNIVDKNEKTFKSDQRHLYKSEKDSASFRQIKTESSETDSNSINKQFFKYKCRQEKKKYDANRQKIKLKIKSRSRKFSSSSNNFSDRENDTDNKRFKAFNTDNIKKEPVELKINDTDTCSKASTSVKGGNSNQKKQSTKKCVKGNKSKKDVETTPLSSRTSRTSKFGRVTVKVGSPDSIMTNSRLVEHAKTLWLSENRRNIDQNDSLNDEDVDALVEEEWGRLSPKLQIRYYTRAQNALIDEDKHSVRRKRRKTETQPENEEEEDSISVLRRYDTSRFISDLDKFMRLKPKRQRDHLKKWLLFYRKLMSRNDYSRFLNDYEQTLNKSRSSNMNESNKPGNSDIEILHRKILFECIKKFKPTAMNACNGRFQLKMEELRCLYDQALWKMITRDCDYNYVAGCRSIRLGRVLKELLDLERNGSLDVLGRPKETNSYTSILSDLETPPLLHRNLDQQCTEMFADLPPIVNIDLAQRILETQSELPVLDLSSLDNFCPDDHFSSTLSSTGDVLDNFRNNLSRETNTIIEANVRAMMHLDADNAFFRSRESSSRSCCDLDSPSCVLSTWLAADSGHYKQTDHVRINKYAI